MQAIILVAGKGSRLAALTKEMPKCFTSVNGKRIVNNAIEALNAYGFTNCIMVVGYKGEMIKEALGNKYGKMKISYVVNDIYDQTNTSYSLMLALQQSNIVGDCYILEGDVFFEKELLGDLMKDENGNSTIVDRYNPSYDGSFVEIGDDNRVIDWVHKSKRPEGYIINDKYKTVNIHKFCQSFLLHSLLPQLQLHADNDNINIPFEYVMQEIIQNDQAEVFGFMVNGYKWFEIDTPDELEIANSIFKSL